MGAVLVGLAVGVAGVGDSPDPAPRAPRTTSPPTSGAPSADDADDTEDATLALAREAAGPSVVSLEASPAAGPSPAAGRAGSRDDPQAGATTGTGVILRSEGIVVTSTALVGPGPVEIGLLDGRRLPGRLVGTDPVTDLAVLDLDGAGYPSATPAGAAPARGTSVVTVAVDPADAAGRDASRGRVGPSRRLTDEGTVAIEGVVAVDGDTDQVALGAATVDSDGDLMGVTTAVADGSRSYTVPLDVVDKVTDDLLADGRAHHSWLGIDGLDSTTDPSKGYGLLGSATRGVVVSSVDPHGPGAAAGLQRADVILAFDGRPVTTMPDLVRWLRACSPGEAAVLDIRRDGTESTVRVTLGTLATPA